MVKKSNLKMGIVPKLTHKKTPDISHLTGVHPPLTLRNLKCLSKGCCNPLDNLKPDYPPLTLDMGDLPPIEAHGSPTKKELIAALVKERKELLKQFRSNFGSSFTANFTSYRVRFDTYLRLKAVNYLLNRFGI